ncbi:hypothetical protein GETHLI_14810 [Geothrix limicola]|uniref:Uncharacterized protein n=2 Tax=Geothrix limicola TaxID=2927978 RepID=A0ABQ5QEG2_9BACT|nr:hypothetical protein GETHLI_14810 [Geothrix limicola]
MALCGVLLALGSACKRPETALREKPVQRVELVQTVPGMTPEEEKALVAQLSEGLGVPVEAAKPTADSVRVFRLTLSGEPNPNVERGRWKAVLVSTGYGALFGALCPAIAFTFWQTWRSAAIATGAGALIGLGYGPTWYEHNQASLKELGYLPWQFKDEWEVLERRGDRQEVVASSETVWLFGGNGTPYLDLKPHLKPLPEGSRSEANIRQASLRAYAEALVQHVRNKK